MIKRVSCVLRLFDSTLCTPLLASQAEVRVDGQRVKPIWKPGGYFVLSDLPEGEHNVWVGSALFFHDELTVNVDYSRVFDERRDVLTVMLNPSEAHPAVQSGISLRGRFSRDGVTVFYIPRGTQGFKIAEDGADAGRTKIKLFTKSSNVRVPRLCYINDKNAKNGEFVLLSAVEGEEYTLASPLKKPHKRAAELVPVLKYRSNADGSFFARLPQGYKLDPEIGKLELTVLVEASDEVVSHTLTLTSKGENDVGVIKI